MAMTKAQLIQAVRRLTRLTGSVPYSDDTIADFLNETIQEVSIIAPFDIYTEELDTTTATIYTVSENMNDFFGLFYYPLAGDKLEIAIDDNDNVVPLVDASAFPSSGYVVLGRMNDWEIVSYTRKGNAGQGEDPNSLYGVTRGIYGKPKLWVANTPVHIWQSGSWWTRLEIIPAGSMYDIGVPDDNTKPSRAIRQGKTIILNRNPVRGYANLLVYGFTTPPALVNSYDTIRGLENREMIVVYLTAIKVLASLGGEEALVRVQAYMPLFQLELERLRQQIDMQIRGMTGQTTINFRE